MSDGYTVKTRELESAATVLSGYASDADVGKSDLDGNTMPAPAAGQGIGADVTKFISQWQDLFSTLSTEFTDLSKNVQSTASVYVTVEENVRAGMSRFAQFN